MSVQSFREHQRQIHDLMVLCPSCWCIVANSVFGSAESYSIVAVFDTQTEAEAYVEASLLPSSWNSDIRRIGGYTRSFRPDSSLWDFNNTVWIDSSTPSRFQIVRELTNGSVDIDVVPHNPAPPAGEMPLDVFAAEAARRLAL